LQLDAAGKVPLSVLPQMVTGIVPSAGGVTAGTGFTAIRTALGTYTVTFTTPFPGIPVIVATIDDLVGVTATIAIQNPSSSGFGAWTGNSSTGAARDEGFSFIAVQTQ
jgi:hypothetical protein